MKLVKLSFLTMLLAIFGVAAWADDDCVEEWDIFQLGFMKDVPTDTATVSTYGVKVGAPISTGAPVYGVEAGVFWAGSSKVVGFQGSLIATDAAEISGLQLAILNFAGQVNGVQLAILNFAENCCGLQIGGFNSSRGKSFQIGIVNYIEDAWLPVFPIVNFKF